MGLADFAISLETGDRLLENGSFVMAEGLRAIQQWVWARLNTYKGEWWLNTEFGLDVDQMMAKPTQRAIIEADLKAEITAVPGVLGIREWSLTFNFATRKMTLVAELLCVGDDVLVFTATGAPWVILLGGA